MGHVLGNGRPQIGGEILANAPGQLIGDVGFAIEHHDLEQGQVGEKRVWKKANKPPQATTSMHPVRELVPCMDPRCQRFDAGH